VSGAWWPYAAFAALLLASLAPRARRRAALTRTSGEWALDLAGLAIQGLGVPLVSWALWSVLVERYAPTLRGSWRASAAAQATLSLVVVDYVYYWNHRLLHARGWPMHAEHHAARQFDPLMAARNALPATLLLCYVWANGLIAVLLREPGVFLATTLLAALADAWRHGGPAPAAGSRAHRRLAGLLVTPHEHRRHHETHDRNFGANWSVWDRLHGTFALGTAPAGATGWRRALPWSRRLLGLRASGEAGAASAAPITVAAEV
jgi:sterol desaturase/sphingolipid hydroxylase (fatty acid hydroxylase superfamily)